MKRIYLDLDDLEKKALSASQGGWLPGVIGMPEVKERDEWNCVCDTYESSLVFAATGPISRDKSREDSEYISAARPEIILELIAEARRARSASDRVAELTAEIERLRKVIRRTAMAFETGCDARETYDRLRDALAGKEAQS